MENISIEPTKKSLEVECSPGYFKLVREFHSFRSPEVFSTHCGMG